MKQVTLIAAAAIDASDPKKEWHEQLVTDLAYAFQLPLSNTRIELVCRIMESLRARLAPLFDSTRSDANAASVIYLQFSTVAPDLEARADKLWSLVVALHDSLGTRVEQLIASAGAFAMKTREVAFPLPRHDGAAGYAGLLKGLDAADLVDFSLNVAMALDAALSDIRRTLLPRELAAVLQTRDEKLAELDRSIEEDKARQTEVETQLAAFSSEVTEWLDLGSELLDEIATAQDMSPEQKQEFIRQLSAITSSLLDGMADSDVQPRVDDSAN